MNSPIEPRRDLDSRRSALPAAGAPSTHPRAAPSTQESKRGGRLLPSQRTFQVARAPGKLQCPRLNLANTCATVTEDVFFFFFLFPFSFSFCGDPPPPGRDSARRRPALQLSTPSPPARLPPAASLPAASPSGGCQLPAVRVTAAEGGRDAAGGGGDPRSRGGRSPVKSPQRRRRKRRERRRGGKPPGALVLAAAAAPRPG